MDYLLKSQIGTRVDLRLLALLLGLTLVVAHCQTVGAQQSPPDDPFSTKETSEGNEPQSTPVQQTQEVSPAQRRSVLEGNTEIPTAPRPPQLGNRPMRRVDRPRTVSQPDQLVEKKEAGLVEQVAPPVHLVPQEFLIEHAPRVTRAEAFAAPPGYPFGVGKITYRVSPLDKMVQRTGALRLLDPQNRVRYAVDSQTLLNRLIGTFTKNDPEPVDDTRTIWFLFSGDQQLNVALDGTGQAPLNVLVEGARERKFDRLYRQWWREYKKVTEKRVEVGDYPALVETYLTSMISRRFGLEPPKVRRDSRDPLVATFNLMFNTESLQLETVRRSMLEPPVSQRAELPLPPAVAWNEPAIPVADPDLKVDPIAAYVPEECFYLRFGTWANQLWLKRLMEENGGDLGRMISLRGFKSKIQSKFLDQLAIESTQLDQMFGGRLISDVAVIGNDTFFDDGASVGVMLLSKNTVRLQKNLSSKRKKFAEQNKGVTLERIHSKVGDEMAVIEFLSTKDNRYRSFHVVAGDCHLICSSLSLAKRFLEASNGDRSLKDNREFQFARTRLPLERDDTVFVFVSTKFFQNLLSPHYQIELRRRTRLTTEMQMQEIASLAAAREGVKDLDPTNLARFGFLPEGFGVRSCGSEFFVKDGVWVDSIRGRRGFFKPIADMEIEGVSADESTWYGTRANFFAENLATFDPMFIAIKRFAKGDKKQPVERVVFDANLAPFGSQKYGWLFSMLGPPLQNDIAKTPEDIIRLQASLQGGSLRANMRPHQIFASVQDQLDPSVDLTPSSAMGLLETLRKTPGYIGAWPTPGYLDWMPRLGGEPDPFGFTYSRLLGLWRLQWDDFAVVSFDRQRLERLKPNLLVEPAERSAQIRLEVGDLANSKLRDWANSVNFKRSWQTSVSNVQLMNTLINELGVHPQLARETAERILNVDLVCSLQGDYELYNLPSGRMIWRSNAWPSFSQPTLPEGYRAPFLNWFRGMELEITKGDSHFAVHGLLDMSRQAADDLPGFDLFKGFGTLFGGE